MKWFLCCQVQNLRIILSPAPHHVWFVSENETRSCDSRWKICSERISEYCDASYIHPRIFRFPIFLKEVSFFRCRNEAVSTLPRPESDALFDSVPDNLRLLSWGVFLPSLLDTCCACELYARIIYCRKADSKHYLRCVVVTGLEPTQSDDYWSCFILLIYQCSWIQNSRLRT